MKRRNRYELWRSEVNDQWYWNLRAHNNEIICQSQGYSSERAARKGIRSVRLNALLSRVLLLR